MIRGVRNNFTDYPAGLPGYPRRLQEAGYETAYVGKWHMGEDDDSARPGFDFWMSHKGQGNDHDNEFNVNGDRRVIPGYYTTVITDAALDWIDREHRAPWLLVMGHKAPHGGPIVPDEKWERAFDRLPVVEPANAGNDRAADGKPAWLERSFPTWHGRGGPLYGRKEYGALVRTDDWKFIRYPHGDGGPDRHAAELYDLRDDPLETTNLAERPEHAADRERLAAELDRLLEHHGASPDRMPLDEGIRDELPKF